MNMNRQEITHLSPSSKMLPHHSMTITSLQCWRRVLMLIRWTGAASKTYLAWRRTVLITPLNTRIVETPMASNKINFKFTTQFKVKGIPSILRAPDRCSWVTRKRCHPWTSTVSGDLRNQPTIGSHVSSPVMFCLRKEQGVIRVSRALLMQWKNLRFWKMSISQQTSWDTHPPLWVKRSFLKTLASCMTKLQKCTQDSPRLQSQTLFIPSWCQKIC